MKNEYQAYELIYGQRNEPKRTGWFDELTDALKLKHKEETNNYSCTLSLRWEAKGKDKFISRTQNTNEKSKTRSNSDQYEQIKRKLNKPS